MPDLHGLRPEAVNIDEQAMLFSTQVEVHLRGAPVQHLCVA